MSRDRITDILYPALFGITVLVLWQFVVKTFGVPAVLLPAPSDIWAKLIVSLPTLWVDFWQTVVRAVIPGWIIASQAIPILAIAPMVIVVLGSLGFTGLLPKSLISMYLCFFPVTIGMVKGLTSPEVMQLDLMRTYHASTSQVLWKLRFPASVPFLFTSLKVAVAIALTGAIVGELPTGAIAGIGARLLQGSYYGQTVQIWAALFMGSFLAAALVWLVGVIERFTLRRMGVKP